jgi:hypothetical protein
MELAGGSRQLNSLDAQVRKGLFSDEHYLN